MWGTSGPVWCTDGLQGLGWGGTSAVDTIGFSSPLPLAATVSGI